MKVNLKHWLLLGSMAAVALTVSCSDDGNDPDPVEIDKTELVAALAEANDLIENTEEGTATGQYQRGAKAELQAAIDLAQEVNDDEEATQTEVDNVTNSLNLAIEAYEAKEVTPIEPEALVGHWTFDEGTGTTAADYSGNGNDGTLSTGHAHWGAGMPEWTTDRYGETGKAIHFDEGANIEIPYSNSFNPGTMTIALWMKADVTEAPWAHNYMVSLNRWNGFKFQLQDAPKAFMTVKANVDGSADPAYYDRDNESPVLEQDVWYHLAVTFGDGHMIFYINGTMVKDWDNTPGTAISVSANDVNLTIGQDLPTGKYTDVEGDDYYVNWGGYFKGVMDEVRIFNKPLTGTQIQSIYDLEKPE